MKPTKTKGPITLPLFDATLKLPSGEVLQLGRFTRKYAAICRNWHIGFLGLDLPLADVWDEKCDRYGKSWTFWLGADPGFLDRVNARRSA